MSKKSFLKGYGKALKFWWRIVGPGYIKRWYLLFCVVVITAVALLEPYLYKLIIDGIVQTQNIDQVDWAQIIRYFVYWGIVSLTGMAVYTVYRIVVNVYQINLENDYLNEFYAKIIGMDLAKHLDKKSGEIMHKVEKGMEGIWVVNYNLIYNAIPSWATMIAVLCMASIISWQMTLITLVLVPIYVLIFGYGTYANWQKIKRGRRLEVKAWGRAFDATGNILAVKSFAKEVFENFKFKNLISTAYDIWIKVMINWGLLNSASYTLSILNRFIIFAGGVYFIYTEQISFGVLIMFLAFSNSIYMPIQQIGDQLRDLQRGLNDLDEARIIFDSVPKVKDVPDAKDLNFKEGKIEFKQASFTYKKGKDALKNVSFNVLPKQVVALVGHSGAGKSTITYLLNRFYDLQKGRILIDGQDISKVTQKSLRENIGMVMQDNTMFNDSILNNIRYGKPGASLRQVQEAAKMANIHDFVLEQKKGYNTKVGERGLKLSGGERQRIALARVILKDPKILILDEATSALDSKNERVIQNALEQVMQGRTTIVIAHRLSTVRHADKIVVMDKGKVAEQGTHQELMHKKGIYKELVDLQVSGFLGE